MIRHLKYGLPLLVLIGLMGLFWQGLHQNPRLLPSTFLNKPAPRFSLPRLFNSAQLTQTDLRQSKWTIVNVWASWCAACVAEHRVLSEIARTARVRVLGIDYKDTPKAAKAWLAHYGNPYAKIGVDLTGSVGIDWGVYGTPETFLIDPSGIVRYKHIGALTRKVWQTDFLPYLQG